jgi:hypothetical protein
VAPPTLNTTGQARVESGCADAAAAVTGKVGGLADWPAALVTCDRSNIPAATTVSEFIKRFITWFLKFEGMVCVACPISLHHPLLYQTPGK